MARGTTMFSGTVPDKHAPFFVFSGEILFGEFGAGLGKKLAVGNVFEMIFSK
jgi:hypothetical protein